MNLNFPSVYFLKNIGLENKQIMYLEHVLWCFWLVLCHELMSEFFYEIQCTILHIWTYLNIFCRGLRPVPPTRDVIVGSWQYLVVSPSHCLSLEKWISLSLSIYIYRWHGKTVVPKHLSTWNENALQIHGEPRKGRKGTPKGTKIKPNGSQSGAKEVPKRCQRGAQRIQKWIQKGAIMKKAPPKAPFAE